MISFWEVISFLGSKYWLIPATLLSAGGNYWKTRKLTAGKIVGVMLLAVTVSETLKMIFREARPNGIMDMGYSLPSGHALNSWVFYGWWAGKKWTNRLVAGIIIGLIGLSRLMLGVHYWWDVVAGWCLGILILRLTSSWRGR